MAYTQVGTFGDVPVIEFDMTLSRGPRASCCLLRIPHYEDTDISEIDTLTIQSNDQPITFEGMVGDISTIHHDHGVDHRREWVFQAWDRRVTWEKARWSIDANIRYRDGTVKPSTQQSLHELYDTLLDVVNEPAGSQLDNLTVYPRIKYDSENAVKAFDDLAKLYPASVCRDNSDSYVIRQTGDGMELPDIAAYSATAYDYQATIEAGPKTVKVLCGPTLFQCFLTLEAVGRDTDGTIKLIDDLSYKPAAGWEGEDPQFFAGVAIGNRHLAFKTVYRMYRVSIQAVPGCSASITNVQQFDLDDTLISMAGSGDYKMEIPAFIKGQFYPYSDHFVNTGSCVHWAGDFRIDHESRCVIFDVPVYLAGSCIEPAVLYLCTGFRVIDSETDDYVRKDFSDDRDTGVGEQVLYHPELFETQVESYLSSCSNSGSPTTNTTAIQEEADQYINAWKEHWDTERDHRDVPYSGTLPLSLSGNIAQITYKLFGGNAPTTRASTYEHEALLR